MEKALDIKYKRITDEFNFWKLYFHTWNFSRKKHERFSEFELDSIAVIMSGDYDKSPLRVTQRRWLVEELTKLEYKITINNVHTRVVKPLLHSGVLFKSEDDGANGEYSINLQLRKLQTFVKDRLIKNGSVPINIIYEVIVTENALGIEKIK